MKGIKKKAKPEGLLQGLLEGAEGGMMHAVVDRLTTGEGFLITSDMQGYENIDGVDAKELRDRCWALMLHGMPNDLKEQLEFLEMRDLKEMLAGFKRDTSGKKKALETRVWRLVEEERKQLALVNFSAFAANGTRVWRLVEEERKKLGAEARQLRVDETGGSGIGEDEESEQEEELVDANKKGKAQANKEEEKLNKKKPKAGGVEEGGTVTKKKTEVGGVEEGGKVTKGAKGTGEGKGQREQQGGAVDSAKESKGMEDAGNQREPRKRGRVDRLKPGTSGNKAAATEASEQEEEREGGGKRQKATGAGKKNGEEVEGETKGREKGGKGAKRAVEGSKR